MSSIYRSRNSPYARYNWSLIDPERPEDPENRWGTKRRTSARPGVAVRTGAGQAGRGANKASLVDMLLDQTATKRPPSQVKPVKAQPRRPGDKDEFRLRDDGTKGMPVRLSSADAVEDPSRPQPGRGSRSGIVNKWFSDGFDDSDDKRTT